MPGGPKQLLPKVGVLVLQQQALLQHVAWVPCLNWPERGGPGTAKTNSVHNLTNVFSQ